MPSDLALWLTLISSSYPGVEHIFMVPKLFQPFKFYCITKGVESNTQNVWNPIRIGMQLIGRQLAELMAQIYLDRHTNILRHLVCKLTVIENCQIDEILNRPYKLVYVILWQIYLPMFSGTNFHLLTSRIDKQFVKLSFLMSLRTHCMVYFTDVDPVRNLSNYETPTSFNKIPKLLLMKKKKQTWKFIKCVFVLAVSFSFNCRKIKTLWGMI